MNSIRPGSFLSQRKKAWYSTVRSLSAEADRARLERNLLSKIIDHRGRGERHRGFSHEIAFGESIDSGGGFYVQQQPTTLGSRSSRSVHLV